MAKPPVASGSGSNNSNNNNASNKSSGAPKLTVLESRMNKAGLAAPGGVISQKLLLEKLDLTTTPTTLDAINGLLRYNLVTMMTNSKGIVSFKFVGKDNAKTMGTMESDEKLIYDQIKDAGNVGMWTKTLTELTGIPRVNMTKALKVLESRKLIVSIKSVKAPTRKMYIQAGITPSVEITGGPWFTDNELDTEFIKELKNLAMRFLSERTVPVSRPNHPNRVYPALAASEYPTAGDVRKFISIFATSVDLREEHVADLLEVMVQDGDVERIFVKKLMTEEEANGKFGGGDDDDDEDGMKKKSNGKGKKRKRENSDSDDSSDEDDEEDSKSRAKKRKLKANSSSKSTSSKKKKNDGKKKLKKSKKNNKKRKKFDSDDSDGEEESSEEDFDSDEDAEVALARKNGSTNDISKKGGAKRKDRKRKKAQVSDEEDSQDDVTSESSQDESESDEELKAKNKRMAREASTIGRDHVYRLTKPYTPRIGRTDMPCGPCPVESFCSEPSRALGRHHSIQLSRTNNYNNSNNNVGNKKSNLKGKEILSRPRVQITSRGLEGVGMLGGVGAAVGASSEKWGESGGRVGTGVAPVNPKTCDYMQNWLDF